MVTEYAGKALLGVNPINSGQKRWWATRKTKLLGLSRLLLAIPDAAAADVTGHFHIIPNH